MSKVYVPEGYKPSLDLYETQAAIRFIKRVFEDKISDALNIKRVSAPLFVASDEGLNDDLNGTERPVMFDIADSGAEAQIVHSLAKWKRYALYKYDFRVDKGLYTDMNAIRRDEELDNTHSVYVDQWDWEKVIIKENRNLEYLKDTVNSIVLCIYETLEELKKKYPEVKTEINPQVSFVSSQELEDMYPNLTPQEREDAYSKRFGTVFITQIGWPLKSGQRHSGRAPDYDDWNLNGDLIIYNEVLKRAFELSSMGIRVDSRSLKLQLEAADVLDRMKYEFHKMINNETLPLTMGGGIGQSRMCQLFLGKAHIGEVQSSVWDIYTIKECKKAGIELL